MGRPSVAKKRRRERILSARVNFELWQRVHLIALDADESVTQVVRRAIREFILRNHSKAA